MFQPPVIAIGGPTGVGKTALAIEIAQRLGTEIISVDSRQLYKELNIGVGRPNLDELAKVKHHFIASHSIHDPFTAKDFQNQSRAIARDIIHRKGSVVLVGGTGLFFNAFFHGFDDFAEVPDNLRAELNREYSDFGIESLASKLLAIDPNAAAIVDLKNPMRVIRAMELILTHQKPLAEIARGQSDAFELEGSFYFLNTDRSQLYAQINKRVEHMIQQGLVNEAKTVHPYKHLNPLKTVGYNEMFDFFDGNCTLIESIEKMKQKTRNYAKRQITWFKNQWNIAPLTATEILKSIK